MRVVFADTVYWVAITNPRDALHLAATEMGSRLGAYRFVTSEIVLVEVLNAMSGDGNHLRCAAADLAQEIMTIHPSNWSLRLRSSSGTLWRSIASDPIRAGA